MCVSYAQTRRKAPSQEDRQANLDHHRRSANNSWQTGQNS